MSANVPFPRRLRWVPILSVASMPLLSAQAGESALYRCQDAQGRIVYSDKPCGAQAFVDSHNPANAQPEAGPPLGNITRQQLGQMLSAYDTAARRLDVDAMLPFLAEELTIEIVSRTPDGMARRVMRKAEFAKRVHIRAGDITDYSSRRENVQFSITPSGAQAEISSTLIENWRQNGQALNMISDEQYLVELRNGKLQFIAMYQMAQNRPHAPK